MLSLLLLESCCDKSVAVLVRSRYEMLCSLLVLSQAEDKSAQKTRRLTTARRRLAMTVLIFWLALWRVSPGSCSLKKIFTRGGSRTPVIQNRRKLKRPSPSVDTRVEQAFPEAGKAGADSCFNCGGLGHLMVRKKDGSPLFCVDYRELNPVTRVDARPIPHIDDTLDALPEAKSCYLAYFMARRERNPAIPVPRFMLSSVSQIRCRHRRSFPYTDQERP
ncbi:hypothetical protein T12_13113 [Trichinella patagoniensis]|uniref:Uncharacterized protein n=1 Tax=Trichinella patagoniensis TaxID=990121 RepID=A0A0V0ZCL6_9BILA|nr:hypothetical protein T12_13113 [Trichinella patagoniensis]